MYTRVEVRISYKVGVEAIASCITVGEDPRSLVSTELERRNVPPVLDEQGRETRGSVGGGAVLNTNTTVAVGVGHVCVAILGVHLLSVPARREGDFRSETVLARGEALRETVVEDSGGASIGLMAAPANPSCVVITVAAPVGFSSNHIEALWVCSDVGPVVPITIFVVDFGRLLRNTVKASAVLEEQGGAPVQGVVGLETSSGAGRLLETGVVDGLFQCVSSVEGVKMGALSSREQTGVETLVAHSRTSAVVKAEVVAIALGGGSGRKASREGYDVETHDGSDNVQISRQWICVVKQRKRVSCLLMKVSSHGLWIFWRRKKSVYGQVQENEGMVFLYRKPKRECVKVMQKARHKSAR
jgi:hypothetical protein